jgi:penicillin amidase
VKAAGNTFGPSMRMVADASDWDHSLLNLPTGQSGHVLSSHYKDQWDAYTAGRSYPMQFRNVQAKDVLILTPR